jgi:GNAT superfamily N-acetyltransferase
MYEKLADVRLKNGEVVEAGIVLGPDEEWRLRVQELLLHKGDIWNWQNTAMLREPLGIEPRFHILHRDGVPFSHILITELCGVGLLSHVWTRPEDRGCGAASKLMELAVNQFRERNGRALYLGTGYDTPPYHIYRKLGFEGIEPESGSMHFFTTSQAEFEAEYFARGEAIIEPLDWKHWPVASALFAGAWPQTVRCAPLKLFGRTLTEGQLLPAIQAQHGKTNSSSQTFALTKLENGAVVGLAACAPDPIWPATCIVDVFCHPNFGDYATEMLHRLNLPTGKRHVAYGDDGDTHKFEVLAVLGFKADSTLYEWLYADAARTRSLDIRVWIRE